MNSHHRLPAWRLKNGASLTTARANSVVKIRRGRRAREEGGTINDWVPEGQAGGDVEYILTARSKFAASVDWYRPARVE